MSKIILSSVLTLALGCFLQAQEPIRVLLITGGHPFEEKPFYELFDSMENLRYDTISQPRANGLIRDHRVDEYDVLVFYDMWDQIDSLARQAFQQLAREGKGMVFLHHSLVSYQDWPEMEKIRGGKYVEDRTRTTGNSSYQHGLALRVKVLAENHPVTAGLSDFTIQDEGYSHIRISPDVYPLLAVEHPQCAPYVAWINTYHQQEIVYILLGHDRAAYRNENYRQLVWNAIQWTAGK